MPIFQGANVFVIAIDDNGEERHFLDSDVKPQREVIIATINWSETSIPWRKITDIVPVAELLHEHRYERHKANQARLS